ncbi:pre-mRNA-splicing factor 18 [Bacillus rossius redtenbacheri]|uniref:pre-mRNA-splicing factor 18 n=1 Tax=Bacillus rossius redtenbacheri TaxID=93214 RepID=UPI002FDEA47E
MNILKAEIERKRKQLEEKNLLQPDKKFFKRADLKAKEEQEYWQKYGERNDEAACDSSKAAKGGRAEDDGEDHTTLPRKDVIRRLRERGEPILLFGETEVDAFKRLRRSEILEPEINKGLRNDFQEALEKVDQAFLDEILASHTPNGEGHQSNDVKVQDDGITYEEIQKMAATLGKGDKDLDMRVITHFIQFLLKMWGNRLNSRPAAEKMAVRGKLACATYTQTQVYLKPLLRKLKTRSLPEDILDSLTEITGYMLERDYIKASDSYLQMAIGNAPWPIGVTMVGIHARTGREKIFSKNVAHVMNDETQRKYLQGLKRLMTKCQEYFPTNPSRCVEYSRME